MLFRQWHSTVTESSYEWWHPNGAASTIFNPTGRKTFKKVDFHPVKDGDDDDYFFSFH